MCVALRGGQSVCVCVCVFMCLWGRKSASGKGGGVGTSGKPLKGSRDNSAPFTRQQH